MSAAAHSTPQEARFRAIFRKLHAAHPQCLRDEWLREPCRLGNGRPAPRPIVWSRRNGPWRRTEILWIGAAPGNAGGKGAGELGAHGTRIPFGGDIAGANLDALLGSIGVTRNHTFITAAYNQLPARGGGEPTPAEVRSAVGEYATSLHVLRDTLRAAGPRLIVALGTLALRALLAASQLAAGTMRLPGAARLERAGLRRGTVTDWPAAEAPDPAFLEDWQAAWGGALLPALLHVHHPSAQNMSPYARVETAFHRRMLDTREALHHAVREVLGWRVPEERPRSPQTGIYALPEWRERIAPRLAKLDRLWREKGV
ncbi:MAG: hypothetical protein HY703_02000 [Gemmatimonadetes bacterium]|nr:hypothetical protein [Gemmatimonadota bacterium]